MSQPTAEFASIEITEQGTVLSLKGDWLVDSVSYVDAWVQKLLSPHSAIHAIHANQIKKMDTAGAFLLYSILQKINQNDRNVAVQGLKDNFTALLKLVTQECVKLDQKPVVVTHRNFFYRLGKSTIHFCQQALALFAFFGEVMTLMFGVLLRPIKLQWRSMIHEIDMGGYRALPIIAVMMFLIGVVIAYQLGVQLKMYGANMYVVDLSGVAILREFSPLISSVIIAGRTSTSFAALLGTMKVNEELDALRTMGLSPIERLVLPKILGLLIALPLLVVWGDIFGSLGSMITARSMDGISFHAFLDRFQQEVAVKHLYIGLVKRLFLR